MTQGRFEWVAVNGRRRGNYFLLQSGRFDIKLDPVSYGSAPVEVIGQDGPMRRPSVAAARAEEGDAHVSDGSVMIACDPPGAEIYADGKFVGQTPSTTHLASETHRVEAKSKGKQTWTRDLEVLKDS
jgi:hypothetical protein